MLLNQATIWLLGAALILAACTAEREPVRDTTAEPPAYVGATVCAECHTGEYERWQNSHHDLAMQQASEDTVLGNFANATFQHANTESTFYQRDGRFFVSTDGPDGVLAEHEILYTFGVKPLQQYLVGFPDGRLQALSISWDARSTDDGGQRWFHLYPDEQVGHTDELHWTGPAQNWNFMCAECHSTHVNKNYNIGEDTFSTTWNEINVACEACHGPGSAHVANANENPTELGNEEHTSTLIALENKASWIMDTATGIARREPPRQSGIEIETCARCHSRRGVLSEDYVHGEALMNTHRPSLLTEDLYYADGQIKEEVYVYGSFLQSAMHAAGVTCADCHDPHSLQLKAPGNSLCAQCHLPSVFDTEEHHRHTPESDGAQCVNCHMPSRDYMVIDGRRDHSFRIPRPDLSTRIGTPNACNACHDDQSAEWATTALREWSGEAPGQHHGETIHAGRSRVPGSSTALAALVDDENSAAIVRATAVQLLASNPGPESADALRRAARMPDALVRMAAAEAASVLDPTEQVRNVAPLLKDPVHAVRLAAASTLMHVPRSELLQSQWNDLTFALEEYRAAQLFNADRAEANTNLGVLHTLENDIPGAIQSYERALRIMPGFAAAYINLADVYRQTGMEEDVQSTLARGLATVPDDADLHHALGLSLVRQSDYENALKSLRKASELQPDQPRFAYVLGIALNSTGRASEALAVLLKAHESQPVDRDVLIALATISRDAGLQDDALEYAQKLLALSPNDPAMRQFVEEM